MAKNPKFTKNTTYRMSINGVLDKTCSEITFFDEDGNEKSIKVADCLSSFAEKNIDFVVSLKTKENFEDLMETEGV